MDNSINLSSTTYYPSEIIRQPRKASTLRSFFMCCLLFQGKNIVYRTLGVLGWINLSITGYLMYAAAVGIYARWF